MDWFVKDGTQEWWVSTQTKRKLNPAHTAGNGFQRSLAVLAGVFIDIPAGSAAQQATYRQWVASVPDGDFTADDGPMAALDQKITLLAAAVGTKAATTHLEEVEQLVRAITVPPTGATAPTEAQIKAWVKAELDARAQRELNG